MKVFVVIAACLGMVAGQAFEVFNENDSQEHPDCHSLYKAGYVKNGTYKLTLEGSEYLVPCEFRQGFGFTIFLNRVDSLVPWDRTYTEYENGFGLPIHDYFSGLAILNLLTVRYGNSILESRFMDWSGNIGYGINSHFVVGNKYSGYKLDVAGHFQGNAPDSISYNNGRMFYTVDHPDPNGCVHQQRGGWWYNYCSKTLPTGRFYNHGPYTVNQTMGDGIYWIGFKNYGPFYSLNKFVMALRHP